MTSFEFSKSNTNDRRRGAQPEATGDSANYSWDSLPRARKMEVLDLVESNRRQRRSRLVTLLVTLVAALLVLGAVAALDFANIIHLF